MRFNLLCLSLLLTLVSAQAHADPIHPGLNSSLCLDAAGGSSTNGTKVQLARCNGNAAQNWQRVGNTLRVLGKCLDVAEGNKSPFAQLQLWDCGDGKNVNQQFWVAYNMIGWLNTNMCLDVPNAKATDGQLIKTFACNGLDLAQRWPATPAAQPAQPTAAAPAPAPSAPAATQGDTSAPNGGRLYTMVNKCSQPVWVAIQQNGGKQALHPSGFQLDPGQSRAVASPKAWGGRIWGRTGCNVQGSRAVCESGDTGNLLTPDGIGGQPTSLAEWTQDGWAGPNDTQDYYDLSHVDGFNLPMAIQPQGGTGKCYAPICRPNLLPNCPADLQVKNGAGKVVVCLSSCTKYQTDDTCCRGAHGTSATCPAPEGARYFKNACPDAYSYAYDDLSSTFVCARPTGYIVTFCP